MEQYIVESEDVEHGPYNHEAAQAKAWDILRTTGSPVWVYRVRDRSLVALAWGGSLLVARGQDAEGHWLPQGEWFDFWA